MTRQTHDHFDRGCRIGPCDCPYPLEPCPTWRAPDLEPVKMPIAGPGIGRDALVLVGPPRERDALLVAASWLGGVLSGALLPLPIAAGMFIALLLVAAIARTLAADDAARARIVRR